MTPDNLALSLAARQGGVITLVQALDCGLSSSSVKRRVRRGNWTRVFRSVYRLIDMTDPTDLVRAAVAGLPRAVVSHQTAAEMHGITNVKQGMAVVTVHSKTTHVFPGVIVHRNHDLLPGHVDAVRDLPTTTLPRTVVDLGQVLTEKHVRHVVDNLIAQQKVTVEDIRSVHAEVARRGKPGSKAVRTILEERGAGPEASATRLELKGLAVLRDGGLPDPILEYPAPWDQNKRLDAAYPDARLAIEWDSRGFHGRIDAFERDRERDRNALVHGWRTVRFTWKDVTERPHSVVTTVRVLLSANSGLPGSPTGPASPGLAGPP